MAQDAVKKLKKGEVLFRENDPTPTAFVVQSGKLALTIERSGKKIEIGSVGPLQVVGEQAVVATSGRHGYGVEALQVNPAGGVGRGPTQGPL